VGRCIYCGSTEKPTDEHVVPINLGGKYVLFKASCAVCQKEIHKVETHCLGFMQDLRYRRKIGGRRVEERPSTLKMLAFQSWDGVSEVDLLGKNPNQKWELIEVPFEYHLSTLVLPCFKQPRILRGLNPWQCSEAESLIDTWRYKESNEKGTEPPWPVYIEREASYWMLQRMIAKIAHGMAVWTFGLDNFRPYLMDIILGKDLSECYYLLGGVPAAKPPGRTPYEMQIVKATVGTTRNQILVSVRLFSDLGAPIYTAIVGEYLKN
jgi:hypothetical protein